MSDTPDGHTPPTVDSSGGQPAKDGSFSPWLAVQLVLGLAILPLALVYLIWKKTRWSAYTKTFTTGLVVVIPLLVYLLVNYINTKPLQTAPSTKPAVLDADLKYNSTRVRLISLDSRPWQNCQMVLNQNYIYSVPDIIQPRHEALAEYSKFFSSNGTSFNPTSEKPAKLIAACIIDGKKHTTEFHF